MLINMIVNNRVFKFILCGIISLIILSLSSPNANVFAYNYDLYGAKNPDALSMLSTRNPLHGPYYDFFSINSTYNEPRTPVQSKFHQGIDFKTRDAAGDYTHPVYPSFSGVVQAAGNTYDGITYVIVKHVFNGVSFYTDYLHLSQITVSEGQTINTTQSLGVSGYSGLSSSSLAHLHYEVVSKLSVVSELSQRATIDPSLYLINYYGSSSWTDDMTLVKNVNSSGRVITAEIYGIYNGAATLPSSAPTIYWKYSYETTWHSNIMNRITGSSNYTFSVPINVTAPYAQYLLYVNGTWYNGSTVMYTTWPAIYGYPSTNPNSYAGNPVYSEIVIPQ